MEKNVYFFGAGKTDGNQSMKEELGGKGANLAEMANLGINVPPGFTISTKACELFYESNKTLPLNVLEEIHQNLEQLESSMGKKLGDINDPLLVSVRSGAAISMPGMMDTVLNLGLNDTTIQALIQKSNNPRFAYDAYRRLLQMFGDVVMNVSHTKFEHALTKLKETKGVKYDTELNSDDLKSLIESYKQIIKETTGKDFPQEPIEQLNMAVSAVFSSWNNNRAISYRRINKIHGLKGTAVNVQSMVFGNMGESSGTGVCFTRDPSTGAKVFYGEYLMNAQGEDVVAGTRTPQPLDTLNNVMTNCYQELTAIMDKLEKHYTDMQDMEFTIQEGKLYILQTRTGKRTAHAAVKIAVDMEQEGLINKETAILRVQPDQLDQLLHKQLDAVAKQEAEIVAKGLPASPGAAVGQVVFNADDAKKWADEGKIVILVRTETSPEDIEGMHAAQGILTSRGGMTSHAAVVARGMGKCCVAGCDDVLIKENERFMQVADLKINEGDWITLDGSTGEVINGKMPVVDPELKSEFKTLMSWADEVKTLIVRTNADTPYDSKVARDFGAEGIGLCRTEHMFFEGDRIKAVREMILSKDLDGRKNALAKLKPMQKNDFKGLFEVMSGHPVVIRLLDPPLHEFLPKEDEDIKTMATEMNIEVNKIKDLIKSLHEFNPMLGFRGCRLAVRYPEIGEMQAQAILEAAVEAKQQGHDAQPWIEVPLIGDVKEFTLVKDIIENVANGLNLERGRDYQIGTMIEVPRAALTADEIAKETDFMSFGTNDLTQMGCGFSRDDSGKFLSEYVEKGIYAVDPFQSIDQQGIGELMKICVNKARSIKPDIHIGICGEHAGEPVSVEFCHKIGLNDVSCSPYRVPIARLAAAHAVIKGK